ncbi:MAG TPA: hypothetical protein VGF13_02135, partial [Verrucomicrobiae bacterium]
EELFTASGLHPHGEVRCYFNPERKDVYMGTFLIVLSVVWFLMALVFISALAAAGRRPCPSFESQLSSFVPQIAKTKREDSPPFLFGEEDAVPAT